ncbi:hypothetical protein GCM10022251_41380 [Phytohabitans flavus]|uniref:Uncharacterized protein n=1 Tax=Phytohabitans flavus TaxID=1076124 RepID=A0A6F8Y0N3_9ACTN|nr:hypothetical protein Pflav_060300 [Phytohabitans flavus]
MTSNGSAAAEAGAAEAATSAPTTPNPASQRRAKWLSIEGFLPWGSQVEPADIKECQRLSAALGRCQLAE